MDSKILKKNKLKRTVGKSFDEENIILSPKEYYDICNLLKQQEEKENENEIYKKLLIKYHKKLKNLNKEFENELNLLQSETSIYK